MFITYCYMFSVFAELRLQAVYNTQYFSEMTHNRHGNNSNE